MGTMLMTKNDDDEDDDGDDDDADENDDGSQQRPQVIWRISASRAGHRRGRGWRAARVTTTIVFGLAPSTSKGRRPCRMVEGILHGTTQPPIYHEQSGRRRSA